MHTIAVTVGGMEFEVTINRASKGGDRYTATVDGASFDVMIPDRATRTPVEWMIVGDNPYEILFDDDLSALRVFSGKHHVSVRDMRAAVARPQSGDGRVKAPIPGLIARVLVEPGQHVESGDPLVVLEAMKMENEVRAPRSGTVVTVNAEPGQSVLRNDVLAEVA